ncbi:DUF2125 domain-containing protein [Sulfitobacter sp. SK012]|uniref:DUF2125 domain-containing protein n=1 Tax=Sulfitobacter sp. SK012 TaxID=1389005 RepID=UPI000E0B5DA1|nr:DUF2125 domain-containing protein [Sulfitobacter sp. SK012]AXI44887.1 DUF2125 domain-containing protein [Sulfitobacter sp. SK012]
MKPFRSFASAAALALVLFGPAAHADVTAAEVWGDWRDYMQGMGYKITADEAASGGQLIVNDIRINAGMGDDAGTMTLSLGSMTFTENGDGSVNIIMPDMMPMTVDIVSPDVQHPVSLAFNYTQSGQNMVASGTLENLTYDYSADSFGLALVELKADGKVYGEGNAKIMVSVADIVSTTVTSGGDLRDYQQSITTGPVSYEFFVKPPEEPNSARIKGQTAGVSFAGQSTIPRGLVDASDVKALLDSGFAFDGNFEFGAGATAIVVEDPANGGGTIDAKAGGGNFSAKMDNTGIIYAGDKQSIEMNATFASFPFPITASIASNGFRMQMPLAKSDTPQDFAMAFNLTEFEMSDILWGLFDPSGQLPRDPATLVLDMSGKAKLLFDLLDQKAAEQMAAAGAQPAEIDALKINSLVLDAVGAKLTGTGDVTFDNTDKVTFPGIPKPIGAINLSLLGGNGLLDKLVAMGFVPEDQAMGARMMMGLFAVPGDTPDTLNSTIEFTNEGQVLANGQRIK